MTRKNIKVPEDLFLALRDDKDDQQSWPHYLEEQCLHGSGGTGVSQFDFPTADVKEAVREVLREELPQR